MTQPKARRDSRRDYRHFPAEYGSLLHAFARDGHASVGPMTEREARSASRDLNRWRMFLSSSCDDDPSDAFARELLTIAQTAIIRVEPSPLVSPSVEAATGTERSEAPPSVPAEASLNMLVAGAAGAWRVTLSLNPIVAAFRPRRKENMT